MASAPPWGFNLQPRTRAVLCAGLPSRSPASASPLDGEAWSTLRADVAQHRLSGLLVGAVADAELATTADQRAEVAELEVELTEARMWHEQRLIEVVDVLEAASVEVRVLKGPALATLDYPDAQWRPTGDIDLLVRGDQLDLAVSALASLGGTHTDFAVDRFPGFASTVGKGATVLLADGLEVDLHRILSWGPLGVRVPPEALWRDPRQFERGGRTFTTLGPEATMLHACAHLLLGGWRRALTLRDVAQVLLTPDLDPDRLLWTARSWGAEAVLAVGLLQTQRELELDDEMFGDRSIVCEWARGYRAYGPRATVAARPATRGSDSLRRATGDLHRASHRRRAAHVAQSHVRHGRRVRTDQPPDHRARLRQASAAERETKMSDSTALNGASPSSGTVSRLRRPWRIAHDYLTQRGGAERVVLSLTRAFPSADVFTSFYEPDGTFPDFADVAVRVAPIDRVTPLRRRHRLALPLLAPTFSRMHIDADVVVCSSSGWAHGVQTTGRKLVYCHAPARWLYQREAYTAQSSPATRVAVAGLRRPLRGWDQKAARSADLYLANSTRTQAMVRDAYGLDAEIVHPPHSIDPDGMQSPVEGIEPGYFLCVARLLPYKNVELAIRSVGGMSGERLVVVGRGPDEQRLRALAGPNISFLPETTDAELRWLYANAGALMAFSAEDFGLTPVEAAVFGTPSIVVPFGGYLDTVIDGVNGVHIEAATTSSVAEAVERLRSLELDEATIQRHAEPFSEAVFTERIQGYVAELAAR